jgi:Kelch motif protein
MSGVALSLFLNPNNLTSNPNGSAHGTCQVDSFYNVGSSFQTSGYPASSAIMNAAGTNWKPGAQTWAANNYSDMAWGSSQGSGTFSTTAGPTTGTGTTRCFSTSIPLYGTFDGSTWTIAIALVMETTGTSGNGNFRVRIYRSTNATGSGATEITTSTLVLGNFALATGTQQNTTVTWTPGSFSLAGEYLFFEISCEMQSGAVTVAGTEIEFATDYVNSVVTTANFTPTTTLWALGTYSDTPGSFPGGNGSDNTGVDQYYADGAWAQIQPPNGNAILGFCSACFDPTATGPTYTDSAGNAKTVGAGGTFFIFGDGGNGTQGYLSAYNPATNTYIQHFATAGAGFFGSDGSNSSAVLNHVAYFIGGDSSGNGDGTTTVCSWATNQSITTGTFDTSYGALPVAGCEISAVAAGSLIYHNGGVTGAGATFNAHWYKWNPLTDTRTALSVTGYTAVAGAAIVYDGGNYIYLIGGLTAASSGSGTNTVQRYSISGNSWTTMNTFPQSSFECSACISNGTIYAGGGSSTFPTPTGSHGFCSRGRDL